MTILPGKTGERWLFWLTLWLAWVAALGALFVHPALWALFGVTVVAAILVRLRRGSPL